MRLRCYLLTAVLFVLSVPHSGVSQAGAAHPATAPSSRAPQPGRLPPNDTAQVPPYPNELSTFRLQAGENDSAAKNSRTGVKHAAKKVVREHKRRSRRKTGG